MDDTKDKETEVDMFTTSFFGQLKEEEDVCGILKDEMNTEKFGSWSNFGNRRKRRKQDNDFRPERSLKKRDASHFGEEMNSV